MFKIGDFSRLSFVTVKTLHYYDEIGLLKPVQVDRFTGYRYYSADQLSRLNYIIALKNLGLSLEKQRRWEDAAETYRTLLERFPEVKDRDRVAFKYGYALQESGRHEEAVAAYEAVLPSASPEVGAETQFWMGECLERARLNDRAVLAYLKIRYLYPDQVMWAATGQLKAAELYTRTGRVDEARKLYHLVLSENGIKKFILCLLFLRRVFRSLNIDSLRVRMRSIPSLLVGLYPLFLKLYLK